MKTENKDRCIIIAMNIPIVISLTIILVSCAAGPKSEKKSPLNYLSGEHYQGKQSIVPFEIKRIRKNTAISGTFYFIKGQDDFRYPVKFQQIILVRNGTKIVSSSTNGLGKYKLSSYLENGEYLLKIYSKNFVGEKEINVNNYEHNNINVQVRKTEPIFTK